MPTAAGPVSYPALQNTTTPVSGGSSWSGPQPYYQSDGRGGVNYFDGYGNPITNTQYRSMTGESTDQIEESAKFMSLDTSYRQTPETTTQSAIERYAEPTATPSTSGGTATEPLSFSPTEFMGTTYNDPASLAQAKRAYIDTLNREQLSALDRALLQATGYRDPNQARDINAVREDSSLGRSRSALLRQVADLLENYQKGETTALGNLNSYYANLGDAYQSSQGVREGETRNEFKEARSDVTRQRDEGIAGLQRTLSDYLYSDQQNRTNLARNYTQTLDSAQNESADALANALGRDLTPADLNYEAPTATGRSVNTQGGLLGALQKTARGTFKLQTPTGEADTSSILKYLYGGA